MRGRGKERMRRYEEAMRGGVIPTTKLAGSGRVQIPGVGEIKVAGSGYISQEEIKISGSGRLPGSLRVGRLKASGSLRVEGDIEAEDMKISGSALIEGSVKAERLEASGSIEVGGGAQGGEIRLSGTSRINGEVHLENSLTSHGSLRVGGDVKAEERIELKGAFRIEGKVSTKVFEAELRRSESHIRDGIKAQEINIYRALEGGGPLKTRGITGDRIRLEKVTCKDITGGDLYVGEGCEVTGKVRYWRSLKVHPDARLRHPPEKIDPGKSG
jgi:cytoskeletal protein CcmA (bactofilin family)